MQKESREGKIITILKKKNGYARMKDFKSAGIRPDTIKKYTENNTLEKIKPGLYKLSGIDLIEGVNPGFLDISKAVKDGVICLVSALEYYDLTTFNPSEIHICIPHNQRMPKIIYPPTKVYYFRKRFYEAGIDYIKTPHGVIKIYNREKTICDMFRYRKSLGNDLALEGLKNYLNSKQADLYKLREFAVVCQVKTIMLPYLKALTG